MRNDQADSGGPVRANMVSFEDPNAVSDPVSPKAILDPNVEIRASGSEQGTGDIEGEEKSEVDKEDEYVQDEVPIEELEAETEEQGSCKVKPVPKSPSPDEVRMHNATHIPFRSWCPKCIAGRGHQSGHFSSEAPLDGTPMISVDYCFLRRSENGTSIPVLIAKVRRLNILFAYVVSHKGSSEVVVAQFLKDINKCGFHGKIVLKGDQEPAIECLMRDIARGRGDKETIIEYSPVRDSSGNGLAEKRGADA